MSLSQTPITYQKRYDSILAEHVQIGSLVIKRQRQGAAVGVPELVAYLLLQIALVLLVQ